MNKFNLKSFSKQPTVLLSEGISVNLFLSNNKNSLNKNKNENKNENEVFDAEKFGKDFLDERKKLANEEIEKLALEIKELDDELDENEVVKKVVLAKEKELIENDINLTIESPKLVEFSENQIIMKKRKEIQKENKKNENESKPDFRLKNSLNSENIKSESENILMQNEADIFNLKKENLQLKNIITLLERVEKNLI